jgi:hypothetical protein
MFSFIVGQQLRLEVTASRSLYPINLMSHDDDPDWKIQRFPFTPVGPETLAVMLPGYLVKFDATAEAVLPALAADDAALGGIIVDLPDPQDDPTKPTVAVAMSGSFNQRQIHYANAHSQGGSPTPLSAVAIQRLRDLQIFLDPSVPTGAFAP